MKDIHKRSAKRIPEYVDVAFEYSLQQIKTQLIELRRQIKHLTAEERNERLTRICRAIRATKPELQRILDDYGPDYKAAGRDFENLAYAASDIAADGGSPELRKSLNRHAEEIQSAICEAIEAKSHRASCPTVRAKSVK